MSDRRQEIYDRIRQSSKATLIWEEMVRLGFWPADGESPNDLASEMARQRELQNQLNVLRTEQSRLRNEEAILAAVRKQRMADSRQKRKETKARREAEKVARAKAWRSRKATEIVFLGHGVSGTLGNTEGKPDELERNGLPSFADGAALGSAMGITVGQLRFLTFSRAASETTHWRRFQVPKKTGGHRLISAPMPRLKAAQLWVLENVLSKVDLHDAAHGFVPGRSIVSNARPHLGKAVVVNLDLKNFFPTVTYPRVWGLFRSLGYSPHISTIFALLCTEPPVDILQLDGKRWYVARGQRVLPQGAPTSPAVTNLLCRRLDRRLTKVSGTLGFTYTRYADDLSFSSPSREPGPVGQLLRRVRYVVRTEGFVVHPDKTRVHRTGRRQEVTGLTVNKTLGVDRKALRRFRAALHTAETKGLDAVRWGAPGVAVLNSMAGYANFVCMVHAEKGAAYKARVKALIATHGHPAAAAPPRPTTAPSPAAPPEAQGAQPTPAVADTPPAAEGPTETADGEEKGEDWWKLW